MSDGSGKKGWHKEDDSTFSDADVDPYASREETHDDPFAVNSTDGGDPFAAQDSRGGVFAFQGEGELDQQQRQRQHQQRLTHGNSPSLDPPDLPGRWGGGAPQPPQASSREAEALLKRQVGPYTLCFGSGVASFVRGGMLGSGIGLVTGLYEGFQLGLWREPPRLLGLVGGRTATQGLQFGGYLGVYQGTKCTMAAARGSDDVINAGFGGCAAGAMGALRTRHPPSIAMGAIFGGAMMMVLESLGHGGSGDQQQPAPDQQGRGAPSPPPPTAPGRGPPRAVE